MASTAPFRRYSHNERACLNNQQLFNYFQVLHFLVDTWGGKCYNISNGGDGLHLYAYGGIMSIDLSMLSPEEKKEAEALLAKLKLVVVSEVKVHKEPAPKRTEVRLHTVKCRICGVMEQLYVVMEFDKGGNGTVVWKGGQVPTECTEDNILRLPERINEWCKHCPAELRKMSVEELAVIIERECKPTFMK